MLPEVVELTMNKLCCSLNRNTSGKTLFVNGHHDKYECWQAGDGSGYINHKWLIVATQGDNISTWAPDLFN
jgi:hypothetical protein